MLIHLESPGVEAADDFLVGQILVRFPLECLPEYLPRLIYSDKAFFPFLSRGITEWRSAIPFTPFDARLHPFGAFVLSRRIVHIGYDNHHVLNGLSHKVILWNGLVDGIERDSFAFQFRLPHNPLTRITGESVIIIADDGIHFRVTLNLCDHLQELLSRHLGTFVPCTVVAFLDTDSVTLAVFHTGIYLCLDGVVVLELVCR